MTRDVPEFFQSTYQKAISGKSKTAAIRAQCQECTAYSRSEISLCSDPGCPLFPYRPYRSDANVKKAKALDQDAKRKARLNNQEP